MTIVYLGLGSNIPDKEEHLNTAILFLKEFCTVKAISPLYLTEPIGFPDQDWFLNCVIQIETNADPQTLLSNIKSIEQKLGRKKTIQNGPRTIDIDILFYGDLVVHTKQLVIPHPRLQDRLFVLQPMMDLNPSFLHPVLHKTIQELYDEHPWSEIVTPYK
jgi:dihydroneopterin aldolase/2-amino-4-hydroxy-6-hydroxymethyldihydropteridine diphosphokinase